MANRAPGNELGVVAIPLVPRVSLPFIFFFVIVGFGDGLGYFLRDEFGLPSPHLIMLPILGLFVLLAYDVIPNLDLRRASEAIFVPIVISVGWAILQQSVSGEVYFLGFGQLVFYLILLSLVRKLFEAVPRRLTERFLGAIVVVHYTQCAYVLLAVISYHAFDINVNLMSILRPLEVSETYGLRHAGLSREPSWAAYSIASTYLGIHYLRPALRLRALSAFVVGVIFINSGTGYLLVLIFAADYLVKRESSRPWLASSLVGAGALLLLTYLQWDRLVSVGSGLDASLLMRGASVTVALQVIADSFPIGTGYGNFQSFGLYGAEFDSYINLAQAAYYKSDVLLLNLVAELGLFGLVCVAWIIRIFWVRGFVIPMLMGLTLLLLFGTALVPAVVGIAAINGLLASGRLHQRRELSSPRFRGHPGSHGSAVGAFHGGGRASVAREVIRSGGLGANRPGRSVVSELRRASLQE